MSRDLFSLIKENKSRVFTRASIKRRSATDGLFESTWQDISIDVKKYGKISNQSDSIRRSKFTFGNAKLVIQNTEGRYNASDDPASLWFGYLNQQRTLVKLETGFKYSTLNESGVYQNIYVNHELPSEGVWEVSLWDSESAGWDGSITSAVFTGVISGDIVFADSNEVTFNIKPLVSVFQEFPARNITGWTSTGITASKFIQMVRDQTDGSGSYIFRPFFGDTSTNWDISTTSSIYSNLNTSTAEDVIDKNVYDIIEKLAEAENFIPYVTGDGKFKFISRDFGLSTTAFEFYGAGYNNSTYGHTIKKLNSYGFRASKYYSRVQVKFRKEDTATSYFVVESTLTVSASNNPWVLGAKTLSIENTYIQATATASDLASDVFSDVSSVKNEVEFETTFIPHLEIFDRVSIFYDPNPIATSSLWDQRDWADDLTNTSNDLIFDVQNNDSIFLNGQEFKFISIEIDLDNYSNRFIAREV